VVVTGQGVVSSLGQNVDDFYSNLLQVQQFDIFWRHFTYIKQRKVLRYLSQCAELCRVIRF